VAPRRNAERRDAALEHEIAFTIVAIGVLGMGAQWAAWRSGVPSIVLLSLAGLAAGPWLGLIHPSAVFGELLRPMISLAVAVVLFEGGLRLKIPDLTESARAVRRLCTVGLLLAWALGTAAARLVAGLSWPTSLVLGALLVVTGPTVIMPMLRQARLERRVASVFKWEGIVNDPLGALLAVVVLQTVLVTEETASWASGLGQLGIALLAGAGIGWAAGAGVAWAFRHGRVAEYHKAPVLLAGVLLVAQLANTVQPEAGLLATTTMGFVLGNARLQSLADLARFKDAITVVLVASVFVILTADMDPSVLLALDVRALLFLAAMLLVVRPIAVLLSTIGAGLDGRERLLLAWIAPRGVVAAAVAGVFGPLLVEAGHADGEILAPLVFALVFATVVLHGFSLPWLARRLGLSATQEGVLLVGASRWSTQLALVLRELDVPVTITDHSWTRLRRPRLAGVRVAHGEVLSEEAEEDLPLHEVGLIISCTDNDAYNALVCVHYGPEFGRDRVWQLAPADAAEEAEDPDAVQATLRGRVLMSEEATPDALAGRLRRGWAFRRTRLTERFGWDELLAREGLPVLVLREDGKLVPVGAAYPVSPEPGDTVVWFAPAPDEAEAAPAAARSVEDADTPA